jgi:hypothetical protein
MTSPAKSATATFRPCGFASGLPTIHPIFPCHLYRCPRDGSKADSLRAGLSTSQNEIFSWCENSMQLPFIQGLD